MPEHLERKVYAKGIAYVILALDLLPFVKPSSREKLYEIRGRDVFDEFVESLDLKGNCFERDDYYHELEKQGYELDIFNHILVKDNFAPTYRFNKACVEFSPLLHDNVQFKDVFLKAWRKWEFWFRLTRNGIIMIIMKLDIPPSRSLLEISKDVLWLQEPFDIQEAHNRLSELEDRARTGEDVKAKIESVQQFLAWVDDHLLIESDREHPTVVWPMAVEIIRQFVQACNNHLIFDGKNGFDIELSTQIARDTSPLRERYIIYHFNEITRYDREKKQYQQVEPKTILKDTNYSRLISALLEGVILEQRDNKKRLTEYFYPFHSEVAANRIAECDCSSWEDEFCVITQRGAAIYALPYEGHHIIFPSRRIRYADYWQCIIRGLEFLLETKVLAQVAEHITSQQLDEVLPFLRGSHRQIQAKRLKEISDNVSNEARLMAHLRTITVPHLISGASYAIAKFESFNWQTGVEKILAHAEANLKDLTSLLERYNDLELQTESQRTNEVGLAISFIFASLTLNLAILTLPSFIQDWQAQGQNQGYLSERFYYSALPLVGEGLVLFLVIVSIVAMTLSAFNLRRARVRRKTRLL